MESFLPRGGKDLTFLFVEFSEIPIDPFLLAVKCLLNYSVLNLLYWSILPVFYHCKVSEDALYLIIQVINKDIKD